MSGLVPALVADMEAVGRLDTVPRLLKIICKRTGMGFAAVARVTDDSWTACAVQDDIGFGLAVGAQLDLSTTLCVEAKAARSTVVIDNVSEDPAYRDHHTPRIYGLQSYISVPIIFPNGDYFGNLCAVDPKPHRLSDTATVTMFGVFADLVALELASDDTLRKFRESVEKDRGAMAAERTAIGEERQAIAEERAAISNEREAILDEREAGELREQFIAVLGHDLRSPLSAISGNADLLARKHPGEPADLARRIKANVKRMSSLIDDVLDFARGRLGGGIPTDLTAVNDLDTALAEVAQEIRDAHPGREIRVTGTIGRPVHCDRARVQQLLANLLSNAVSHGSPDDPVLLSAGCDGTWVILKVSNSGRPIPPASLGKVFAPFWRHSTSGSREGLGLGLFICSQIIRQHHGDLAVSSTAAEGTSFTARLPLRSGN